MKPVILDMVWLGFVMLFLWNVDPALADPGYDDGAKFKEVCSKTLGYLADEGFGALLAAASGLGAVIAAAMGGFRAAWALLITSIGAFLLKNYVEIWFAPC